MAMPEICCALPKLKVIASAAFVLFKGIQQPVAPVLYNLALAATLLPETVVAVILALAIILFVAVPTRALLIIPFEVLAGATGVTAVVVTVWPVSEVGQLGLVLLLIDIV